MQTQEKTILLNKTLKFKNNLLRIIIAFCFILLAISMLFPYFYMVTTSLTSQDEFLLNGGMIFIPKRTDFSSYKNIWQEIPFFSGILNTLLIELPVVSVGSFTSGLAAFAFAKMKLKRANFWLLLLMSSMMIPYAALMLPQFEIYNQLNLVNTLWPLIIPGLFGNVSMIFFFIQYLRGVPTALVESAKIDGCGYFVTFIKVVFPLFWPAIAAQGVFWFLGIWNDYFGPSIYLTKKEVMTLQPLLQSLNSTQGVSNFPLVMTGAFLSSVPLIAIFLIFQKYFIRALSITSGIKG